MRLHCETMGSGPDLALLHGWAMHSGIWRDIAERLATRYRVTLIDLPGHGHSPAMTGPVSLEAIADDVAAVLPGRGAVLGWSLGGLIALTLALQMPGSVARLVLVGSTPQFMSGPGWPHGLDAAVLDDFAARLCRDPKTAIHRFLALQVRGSTDERQTLARLKTALSQAPAPCTQALDNGLDLLRSASLRTVLPTLMLPVTLIHGTRDVLTPFPAAVELANALPQAQLHPIDGAGHSPFLSHADTFLDILDGLSDAG